MKRLLALIIIVATIIPLFVFPISAAENDAPKEEQLETEESEEESEKELEKESEAEDSTKNTFTMFENEQYTYIDCKEEDKKAQEFKERLIAILEDHTGVKYNAIKNNKQFITLQSIPLDVTSQICYYNLSDSKVFDISFNDENKEVRFDKIVQAIQASPKDKIVLDETFFDRIYTDADLDRAKKEESFWDKAINFFETVGNVFKVIFNLFDVFEIDNQNAGITITSGGFNLIQSDSELNKTISKIYNIMYPIGFAVMLLCWSFGMAKSTISASLDIKDKSSILHSIISLIIGLAAMSLAPQILTLLTGISRWLCEKIGYYATHISLEYFGETNLLDMSINASENGVTLIIIFLVIDLIFIINILWIALLQCLSPIFIGLMANEGTRKISFNFIKEYFKALLVPVLTVCYFGLVNAFQYGLNNYDSSTSSGVVTGLLASIVLAISTLGIAGKKLDKLIN